MSENEVYYTIAGVTVAVVIALVIAFSCKDEDTVFLAMPFAVVGGLAWPLTLLLLAVSVAGISLGLLAVGVRRLLFGRTKSDSQ